MEYVDILYFVYDSTENMFYDQCGFRIVNIFEELTPNDIFLFRSNPGYYLFKKRNFKNVWCKILTEQGGLYDT